LGDFEFSGVARLRPGVSRAAATNDLQRLLPVWLRSYPGTPEAKPRALARWRIAPLVRPLSQVVIGGARGKLWAAMGASALLLLLACANVLNLFFVRAEARRQDFAIRVALGATSARAARGIVLEGLLVALAAGACALALARAGIALLQRLAPAGVASRRRAPWHRSRGDRGTREPAGTLGAGGCPSRAGAGVGAGRGLAGAERRGAALGRSRLQRSGLAADISRDHARERADIPAGADRPHRGNPRRRVRRLRQRPAHAGLRRRLASSVPAVAPRAGRRECSRTFFCDRFARLLPRRRNASDCRPRADLGRYRAAPPICPGLDQPGPAVVGEPASSLGPAAARQR